MDPVATVIRFTQGGEFEPFEVTVKSPIGSAAIGDPFAGTIETTPSVPSGLTTKLFARRHDFIPIVQLQAALPGGGGGAMAH